jgi:formylglycine-generating enzyme required for sulfatase activity/serine/threonine protein kinase
MADRPASPPSDPKRCSRPTRQAAALHGWEPSASVVSVRDPLGISGTLLAETYRVGEAIGDGGFSVVYRAEHVTWKQPVAIKCFKVLTEASEEQRRTLLDGFLQEGKLMAQLSSRSAAIVQARDVGDLTTREGQRIPYIVLEWLDGKALDIVLWDEARGGAEPRSLHEAMTLLEPAAAALEIAHRCGIAHRDLKPANFFVLGAPRDPGARVKVLDFGIAKVMAEHVSSVAALALTGKEITAFTPNYGAPEQFSRSCGATGPWTDVFAMALVLVEILRGGVPALGGDLLQMALTSRDPERRPTPRTLGVSVPEAVEQVFQTALAVAPADRYASMGLFWCALTHAVFPDAPTWQWSSSVGASARRDHTGPIEPTPGPPVLFAAPVIDPRSRLAVTLAPPSASRRAAIAAVATVAFGVGGLAASRMLGAGVASAAADVRGSTSLVATPPLRLATMPIASAPASATAAPPARRSECPTGMVLVPGGRFVMGSDEPTFKLWQPAHKVNLDTFCIDIDEVTAAAYKACSDVGECQRPPPEPTLPKAANETEAQHDKTVEAYAELCNFGKEGRERHPINCVPWALADGYCKVSQKRLPTEAEWELAARGGGGRKFPWGDEPGDATRMNACGTECNRWELARGLKPSARMFDADDGFAGTAPVGSFPRGKTKHGANDFVGNVGEWTADWFETYEPDETINPRGARAGDRKVIRGGGFDGAVTLAQNPAFRQHELATASAPAIGFRCAATL